MSEQDKVEAEQRMLEVLLVEEFDPNASHSEQPVGDLMPASSEAPRRRVSLPMAATALLGIGVVTMLMLRDREADLVTADSLEAQLAAADAQSVVQDPQAPKRVVPKDVDDFLRYLNDAQKLEIVAKRTVGAASVRSDDGGSADELIVVSGLRARVARDRFANWCKALRDSARSQVMGTGVADVYTLELRLSRNRIMSCFCSWGEADAQIWLASGYAVRANEELHQLFTEMTQSMRLIERLESGVVKSVNQLNGLPKWTNRIELTREIALAAESPPCFGSVEYLTLGGPDEKAFSVTARMPKLRHLELRSFRFDKDSVAWLLRLPKLESLVLRDCDGLTAKSIRTLGGLRSLRKLHCIDTVPGGDVLDLSTLVALPVLDELGLRAKTTLVTNDVAALLRTKLSRLWLVDVDVQPDLTDFVRLPTLRELMLVAPMRDAQLERLAGVKSLRRLIVRNAKANGDCFDTIKLEVPQCQIDWTLNSRWFDTGYAFEYIDGLPPLTK